MFAMLFATHMQAHNPAHEVFALKFAQTFVRVICFADAQRNLLTSFAVIMWLLGCFTFDFLPRETLAL